MKKLHILSLLISLIFLAGCRMSASNTSFDLALDAIDSVIVQKDLSSAKALLKKAAGKNLTDNQCLSLVKRYYFISDLKDAEKLLKRAFNKNPSGKKITAVYTDCLLRQGKFSEALKPARLLSGSEYESLSAEAVLRSAENKKHPSLVDSYKIAGSSTGNPQFFMNAALIEEKLGNKEKALVYHPVKISLYDDELFWAKIAYDAGDYFRAIEDLSQTNLSEGLLLKADSYVQLEDYENALAVWQTLLEKGKRDSVVLMNAARASENNLTLAKSYLFELVENFPDYCPGLVAYGDFAKKTRLSYNDDFLTREVRKSNLKSLDMIQDEAEERIPVSDAIYRMDNFLERNKKLPANPLEAEKAQFYELAVERTKLNWFMNDVTDSKQKEVDIWSMLEKYSDETNPYPKYLVRYAAWFFLTNDRVGEAESLLKNHFLQKNVLKNTDNDSKGIDDIAVSDYSTWEAEDAAYIDCVKYQNYARAKALYEMLQEKRQLSRTAMLNLGGIYEAESEYNKATSLYAEAARKTEDLKEKSEIHYRIAQIQLARNDFASARLSLNYAIQLDSGNTRARLLLKKIK